MCANSLHLSFQVTLFPCGGSRLVALDFLGPEVEDGERQDVVRQKRRAIFRRLKLMPSLLSRFILGTVHRRHREDVEQAAEGIQAHAARDEIEKWQTSGETIHRTEREKSPTAVGMSEEKRHTNDLDATVSVFETSIHPQRRLSLDNGVEMPRAAPSAMDPDATTAVPSDPGDPCEANTGAGVRADVPIRMHETNLHATQPVDSPSRHRRGVHFHVPTLSSSLPSTALTGPRARTWSHLFLSALRGFAVALLSPASLSVIVAFPIALITPLKGLFVPLSNSPIPNAPDGQPPLAFVMDTTSFVGAASVPLGLLCLGSALARLKVPMTMSRDAWATMPVGAIMALALGKIVVMPVVGVAICQGLTTAGVIDRSDKVLRFVCM